VNSNLLALLKRIEWIDIDIDEDYGPDYSECPECRWEKLSGHADN
jgi:hypothetical protein